MFDSVKCATFDQDVHRNHLCGPKKTQNRKLGLFGDICRLLTEY